MSAGRTITSAVAKDRVISKFPQAFHPDATPYQKMNFHPKVKAACTENRTGRVGLKISKAVLVGDVAVGKTCLVNRFCHDVFDRDYKATIGVDFEVEKFSILSTPFTLQIWDTAGQERFKCIAASYYRGANIVMVAFDLSDEASLRSVPKWMDEACENAADPIKCLVGTKKDLMSPAGYIDVEFRAMALANQLGAEFWAVSSKTGENVRDFFFRAVSLAFDNALLKEVDTSAISPTKQIGNDLINVQRENTDMFERRKKKMNCCQ
ncbi:ras-related protein Rab-34-like [Haliotis rufescens]|uniref:ras-related protein Rab-34-like n=1 Tax=Haliotis rufescens TaxID=6454 RepID=UPI001EB02338|nr:ras-related protein Rab-34-like [Haliotis rufescens]XP_046374447.1 ras-related protein Rab-34-like [Haliotis rufescens]XP_046374448.1 ras-related protein Rab-34-like [Haliotis rufescens]